MTDSKEGEGASRRSIWDRMQTILYGVTNNTEKNIKSTKEANEETSKKIEENKIEDTKK